MAADWYALSKEITKTTLDFGFRVYVSIADIHGNIKYLDSELETYADIITQSIQINIPFIAAGDYCIPFSNKNLMIFKISEKGIVVLFANKGNIAQLLSFKRNIKYFKEQIDNLIGDIEIPGAAPEAAALPEVKRVEKAVPKQIFGKELPSYYPILDKKLGDKLKATVEEIGILHLCDGQTAFTDIVERTNQDANSVYEFIIRQIKKKVIRSEAQPLLLDCPDCKSQYPLLIPRATFKESADPFTLLVRSEACNHEFVAFINPKLKVEYQSFKYFTDFQKDKFMKRLGEHYYTILS